MKQYAALLLVSFAIVLPDLAVPITFDLRDTGATGEIESGVITRNGITAALTPFVEGSSGSLNQTAGGFGVDATESGDNTHELDAAKGVESIAIEFNQSVRLTKLTLSDFTTSETGLLKIGANPTTTLTGTTPASDVYDFATDNLVGSGETFLLKWETGNGFSFDAFTVDPVKSSSTVPDSSPGIGLEAALLGLLLFGHRRFLHVL